MKKCLPIILIALFTQATLGSELIFEFKNPAFGGNPLYGEPLLDNANAQNDNRDPDDPSTKSELERFNDLLQRSILSRVSSIIAGNLIGPTGQLTPGLIETTDFVIEVLDLGGGLLEIRTTDKATGNSTSFEVQNLF